MHTDREYLYRQAADHLSAHDPQLAALVARFGPCTILPESNYYQDLVESIIGQQLSVKAAASIRGRFNALFGSRLPTPEEIVKKSVEDLRSAGLSGAKANYVRDLAQHIIDGKVTFDGIEAMTNEEIITKLTDVKGIGEWTVHMFLLFCMGRMDILPWGDLGIRNAIVKSYGLDHMPSPQEIRDIADKYHWHPYESVASWYLWRSLENVPARD